MRLDASVSSTSVEQNKEGAHNIPLMKITEDKIQFQVTYTRIVCSLRFRMNEGSTGEDYQCKAIRQQQDGLTLQHHKLCSTIYRLQH